MEGGREWRSSLEAMEELEVTCCIRIVQQSDKPMLLYQDFDFLGEKRTFWFFLEDGKCELFPYS